MIHNLYSRAWEKWLILEPYIATGLLMVCCYFGIACVLVVSGLSNSENGYLCGLIVWIVIALEHRRIFRWCKACISEARRSSKVLVNPYSATFAFVDILIGLAMVLVFSKQDVFWFLVSLFGYYAVTEFIRRYDQIRSWFA